MDAIYNTITIFSTMILFYLFFYFVINPKTNMIQLIGDRALATQKSYNRYFLFMLMVPAFIVALLSMSSIGIALRNVVVGVCLGTTVFVGIEVNRYREVKFGAKKKKKK